MMMVHELGKAILARHRRPAMIAPHFLMTLPAISEPTSYSFLFVFDIHSSMQWRII